MKFKRAWLSKYIYHDSNVGKIIFTDLWILDWLPVSREKYSSNAQELNMISINAYRIKDHLIAELS